MSDQFGRLRQRDRAVLLPLRRRYPLDGLDSGQLLERVEGVLVLQGRVDAVQVISEIRDAGSLAVECVQDA